MATEPAKKKGRKTGKCGQIPSDFPKFTKFLLVQEMDRISFNPDAVIKGIKNMLDAEK